MCARWAWPNHGPVDLGMQIWSKGLVAGIDYARGKLDELEN